MQDFWLYTELGYRHILDLRALDHIIFLIALSAVYSPEQWKSLLITLTAFTLGHSATLILATLGYVQQDQALIEFLIPITILITAILNVFERQDNKQFAFNKNKKPSTFILRYVVSAGFGLIHGLGFSGYISALLMEGDDMIVPLLGFNLGVELGQIVFVLVLMTIAFVWLTVVNKPKYHWNLFLSGGAFGMALQMIISSLF